MPVVLFSSDLSTLSRVESAGIRLGKSVQITADANQLLNLLHERNCELVILDLSVPSVEISEVVKLLKADAQSAARIIAFGPHVHENRLAAARDAGCDLVVSRGQFFSQLDSILAQQLR